ncbi:MULTISPECIES: hypothetical protein [Leptospira]|uniref:PF09345 domain protein n=4 Tax=Leptospira borgpetersenii TaxID=174 RepID=A0A0E3BN21_LEPBO|nr:MULTISPECIES: hypothetical protein [Leptospira]EMO07908.1 PF09345 domain protein [Leptospira borgpetersenii str. Noumea 25]ALO25264.1 hypothetical protein LBBP_00944 [Leptospira borgpetersenii serovar Ballum]ANH00209.1 Uncharacterized protein LB4E_0743 [Leptospira borgpetersenii str. 4E]AXX15670.1 hypothetical protein C4Q31_09030 [Leptospira borgpetersenii serovar Ceylonica]EKP13555.1 PF09345 domain protein [Leptospira borgpetersenii str. 200801926]
MSLNNQIFSEDQLQLEVVDGNEILIRWLGKSVQRNPSQFIIPTLSNVMKRGSDQHKAVIWDFRELEYMNSSTITPVIKTLEMIKKGNGKVKLIYNKTKKWQDLSFSALRIFETKDGRIQVIGQ